MAHTNATANYELSQFLGTDKPAWLVDYNGDMLKIDTALKANADAEAASAEDIQDLQDAIGAEGLTGRITAIEADAYYGAFVPYILKRKPDIIGHFDLITKFDEKETDMFLRNAEYEALAERYTKEALKADCIFEVNTGAISRGYRQTPYPSAQLLHVLKREGGKVMLSSDSHAADTIDCAFAETRQLLKDIGFQYVYVLYNGEFQKDYL